MKSLKVGMVRYKLMLREDGHVFDDVTCARIAADHFVVTTTTAQAGPVLSPYGIRPPVPLAATGGAADFETDAWAQFCVAGPNARKLLERIADGFDLSNKAFPFMACAELSVCGAFRRLARAGPSAEVERLRILNASGAIRSFGAENSADSRNKHFNSSDQFFIQDRQRRH